MTWPIILSIVVLALAWLEQRLHLRSLERRIEDVEGQPRGCFHPETENVGTFGLPEYRCVVCHAKVTG